MIKVDKHNIEFKGTGTMLLSELSMIVYSLKEKFVKAGETEKEAESDILFAVNEAFKSIDTLKKEALEKIKGMTVEELIEMMDEFMEGEKEND